jgi:hypothetical protein
MSTQQHHHRHHHHHQASETENIQTKAVEDGFIQLRAYEIYCEKGGYALDNWLEAEQAVKNNH